MQTYEVQSGLTIDHTAVVLRLAFLCEHRQIDPVKFRIETGAPDDIGDVNYPTVSEQRPAIFYADPISAACSAQSCAFMDSPALSRRCAAGSKR